jgi:hypothetical protein
LAKKHPNPDYLERCMSEAEKNVSILAGGLVPKPIPHEKNSKWVAKRGTRKNCGVLGKRKNYAWKLIMKMLAGTIDWLKQFETKTNEPNSYEIPIEELENFNSRIIELTPEKNPIRAKKKKYK